MIILFTAAGSKKTKEKETKSILPRPPPQVPTESNTVTLLNSSSALTKREEKGFSCNRKDGQTRGDRQLPLPGA